MMKRVAIYSLLSFAVVSKANAQAEVAQAIAEGIKKVIRAIDLKIQRLQNETIWLQNAAKTVENAMSKLRLDEISDWVEKQRKLYAGYFDELWQIKTAIGYYRRIREVVDKQKQLVKEYQRARDLVRQDRNFSKDEIEFMYKVYSGILDESIKNLDQLFLVATAFATQMSDAKRLEIINTAADNIEQNLTDLRQFNSQNMMISMQRAKERNEIEVTKKLYGLQ
jgi:hypothetical protein